MSAKCLRRVNNALSARSSQIPPAGLAGCLPRLQILKTCEPVYPTDLGKQLCDGKNCCIFFGASSWSQSWGWWGWATKAALPWQRKDQKGHVLSLIYTLPWRSQHSCQLRQATPATVTSFPALLPPPRATSRVSQICITNVSFSGCLTLHNPFQHANPLKVMAPASTRVSPQTQSADQELYPVLLLLLMLLLRLAGMALFHIFSGNICVRFALQSKRCELCFLLAYKI